MKKIKYYARIWYLMTKNAFLVVLAQKLGLFIFLFGKVLRFGMYFFFLLFLTNQTGSLAGYSAQQVLFIFLTFNIIDVLGQFLYREVYRFRPLIVSGDFDLVLTKPMSALFRSLMGGADLIDLITIPPLFIIAYLVGRNLALDPASVILYILMIINGLLIVTAFYAAVVSMAIITLEIDHTVMIYRDFSSMGRFPVEIYKQPFKSILTFIIPVAIMITLPARVLFGQATPADVIVALAVGMAAFYISMRFWKYALSRYTSASS